MTIIRVAQTGSFTYDTEWQVYVCNRVGVLSVTDSVRFSDNTEWQCSFTCDTVTVVRVSYRSADPPLSNGCVDPTGCLEVWRSDLSLFTYRIHIAVNPAHSLVTGH